MGKKKKQKKQSVVSEQKVDNEEHKENSHVTDEEKLNFSVDDLLERVDKYIEAFQFDLAFKFCEKALVLEPDNTKVLETIGNVCAENGEILKAKEYYMKAVEIKPEEGFVKYLYLGQICEGKDAVEFYLSAVKIMKSELTKSSDPDKCKNDLSNVYCSLAELYMTDCCMEESAQLDCEKYCDQAIECNKNNPDAYLARCNYLLSCNEMDEAKITLEKAFDLWKSFTEQDIDNIPNLISYDSRLTLVKILIEIELYDKVSCIIDQLIEENEDDVRIWYYLGLAKSFLFTNKETLDNPRFYLEKAVELFEKTGYEDDDMREHIEELLKSCPFEEDMETIEEDDEEAEDIKSDEEQMES